MNTPRQLPLIVALWISAIAVAGCSLGFPDGREDCDGYPYVANDVLPDTVTLRLDGPEFRFDLAEAPVFKHTEGKPLLDYRVGSNAPTIVGAFGGSLVRVYPRSIGTTFVSAGVFDDCEKSASVQFFVKVVAP